MPGATEHKQVHSKNPTKAHLRVKMVQGTNTNQNMSVHTPAAKVVTATSANGGRHAWIVSG
jgi:hypothetical protein